MALQKKTRKFAGVQVFTMEIVQCMERSCCLSSNPVRQPFLAIYQEKLLRFRELWRIISFLLQIMSKGILVPEIFLYWLTDKLITKHGILF
jgi:hypothetical protein